MVASPAKVTTERHGDVLVIQINNPPMNAGSIDVRRGILKAVAMLAADESLRAGVIVGGGKTFIAGSDLREFGQPLEDPQLPAVIAALEQCAKPVVAALHGAALGGGFELALGCDARVALAGALVGLPEVTLGMLPGAGGTQRLPRLVGRIAALNQILSGERVKAARALELGMIDAVFDEDLVDAAVSWTRALKGKRIVAQLPVPGDDDAVFEDMAQKGLKRAKGRPNVQAAIEAVRSTRTLEVAEGLRREREAFQHFRVGPDAMALRYQFFAERQALKTPELDAAETPVITRIAIIGAGTMGAGIAIAALDAGYTVRLLEQEDVALSVGLKRIRKHYEEAAVAGKLPAAAVSERFEALHPTTDWEGLADADLVIEAIYEDLAAKQAVFGRLAAIAKPGAVLASNTSYLDMDAIADVTDRPEDVIGLHFFSPANVMRLVEVVRGAKSSPAALKAGMAVATRMRKLPVLTRNAFGFIGNRIYAAYRSQCEFMLEDGASPDEVDAALQAWGFAMGPFAVGDMSGLDIAWRMRQIQSSSRDPSSRYVHIADRLCEAGRFGRKSGAGYYRYSPGSTRGERDPEVDALINAARTEKGIRARMLDAGEIQERALLAMVNEAALLLAEGVARSPEDVDLVMVNGYGFPKWRGGPIWWARAQDGQQLDAGLQRLSDWSGPGFRRAEPKWLMQS